MYLTLWQVEEAVARHPGVFKGRVCEVSGLKFFTYNRVGADIFDNPDREVLLECRGIAFRPDEPEAGPVSRPFHKFFNLGELEQEEDIDLSGSWFETKVDGSMVRPVFLPNGSVSFATKAGVTDVALEANKLMTKGMSKRLADLMRCGYTLLFEYTAPSNRIVISYSEASLTLLAVRRTASGHYYHRPLVLDTARRLGICGPELQIKDVATLRARTDIEGVVIVWPNGHRLKVKTTDYLRRHHAMGALTSPRGMLRLVVSGTLDDALPLWHKDDQERALRFQEAVFNGMDEAARILRGLFPFEGDIADFARWSEVKKTGMAGLAIRLFRSGGCPLEAVQAEVQRVIVEKNVRKVEKYEALWGGETWLAH